MKQRGRHRRRKRGRALRGILAGTALALTAAATMISASQATVAEDPGALKPLARAAETDVLRLHEHLEPPETLDRLAKEMGRPVGVRTVVESADRPLPSEDCPAADREALPVEPAVSRAYCWDAEETGAWEPGAVTTSADADDDGLWGGDRVVLAAWSHPASNLSRVAVIDANDLDRLTYTWVLLTVPVDGGRDYRALDSDVSGMVWYQDKLLVTAERGLYVYDVHRIQQATVDSPAVGRVDGGWSAAGHTWVLPAVGHYDARGAAPAYVALDRSTAPDSLVAGERVAPDSDRPVRLWRYDFSRASDRTGLLETDPSGRTRVDEAYETAVKGVAGVLSYDAVWYLARTAVEPHTHGTLWRQDANGAASGHCGADDTSLCWTTEAHGLSYAEATGEVWSQAGRMLFSLPLTSLEEATR